nr:GNAT family N-acetyltransferase [Lachnospiraceae bacterium]
MSVQKAFTKEQCAEAAKICEKVFPSKYFVTENNLERKLINDADFCPEASLCICDKDTGKMLGFIGTKISHNRELYPDTAWLSVLAVDKNEQRKGYGSALVKAASDRLALLGVKNIIVGEDFVNFFSGIPEPDEAKTDFFRSLGFWVGDGNHYDLEADIVNNPKIE